MPIIDSHTHIHFPAYDKDREAVIKRAQETGVKMITVGTQMTSSEDGVKLAHQYPNDIWATVGFHPNHVVDLELQEENRIKEGAAHTEALAKVWHHDENEQEASEPEKFDLELLRKLAHNPKVVAIGECGLDYYRLGDSKMENVKKVKELQKEVFIRQIELAQKVGKALMIHCRPSYAKATEGEPAFAQATAGKQISTEDAYQDLLSIVSSYKLSVPKIVHFYVGGLEITNKFIKAGFYFTFGGVITFPARIAEQKRGGADRGDYDEVIKLIPLERILLETDAPYVAPLVYRGQRNEPAYIIETAKKMAELKGVSYNHVEEIIVANAQKVFGIKQ